MLKREARQSNFRQPATTIVIVNYNSGQLVLDCVESVRKFTQDYELLIVDNASTDGSAERLGRLHSGIRIIRNDTNLGFAKANNIGIRESKGKYIVLMNSDILVNKDWLEKLVHCIEKGPRIGVATPKLMRTDGRLDSTGHLFWFIEVEGKNRGEEELDDGQYDASTELLSCDFACCMIKREVLDDIGPLDETFFFYHEDIDFCLRARMAGWRVIFCPSSVVRHRRGGSTLPARRRTLAIQRKKYLLRLSLKNYSLRSIAQVLMYKQKESIFLLLALLAGLKNRDGGYIQRKLDELGAMFVSFFWNAVHLPIRERIVVQRRRRIDDDELQFLSKSTKP